MPTPRARLTQERSRQRREALLQAAVDLFVEGGSRAVTHRAVAAAAGLPSAATTYYFETIDELLRAALQQHIDGWLASMENLTSFDAHGAVEDASTETATQFAAAVFAARPPEVARRQLAVLVGAASDPELRPAAARALTKAVEVLAAEIGRIGIDDPEALAEDLVAGIAGVALRRSAGVHSEPEESGRIVRLIRAIAIGHLADEETALRTLEAARSRVLSGRSGASR